MRELMRRGIGVLALMSFMFLNTTSVLAQESLMPQLGVTILSPQGIKGYAGKEDTVKVRVTNNSDQTIQNVLVYITMADIQKNATVNLEDFNADKPVVMDEIKAHTTVNVDLPVRFVYTSQYDLYVTAISKTFHETVSSSSIPVQIIGNTKVDKNQVLGVSIAEPLVAFVVVIVFLFNTRRQKNI